MPFAHFIARRIVRPTDGSRSALSRPIVVIAVLGIVIGMAVMILTVGISTGFQREVRAKVTGAGSHIEIVRLSQHDARDTPRMPITQPFYPWLDTLTGVKHISVFAVKPGIVETDEEIQGVAVKGVGADHDWSFLREHLVAGDVLNLPDTAFPGTVISQWMADRLKQGVGDTVTIYLIKGREDIRPRRFQVRGIYETGLEKVDHQLVFTDIGHIQRFARWGLQAEISVYDSSGGEGIGIEGLAFGGDSDFRYTWPGSSWEGKGPHWLRVEHDTTITLIVSDNEGTIPDTAWVHLRIPAEAKNVDLEHFPRGMLTVERGGTGGSHAKYCGGFEVAIRDMDQLMAMDDRIYNDYLGVDQRTITVKDRFPEIFTWLELLDKNVVVVIVLMTVVAMINMMSALLIIILERTNMIGVLKALGASNTTVRGIFLIDAAYILGAGIMLGDLLGIGLAVLQNTTGLVRLPIESYYVDAVQVDLQLMPILLLNAGTLIVCVLALILPTLLVTRIAPARAIRFE